MTQAAVVTNPHMIAVRLAAPSLTNYALAAVAVTLLVTVSMAANTQCCHWFVVPVAFCGVLTGADVVAWLRRGLDTFDPKAIVGILWLHGTFVAPLLHVGLEAHTREFDVEVRDWPTWFGRMALLNLTGLILYKLFQRYTFTRSRPARTIRVLSDQRFVIVFPLAIMVSAAAATVILARYGGLRKESEALIFGGGELVHLSWLLMLGDPLAVLLGMGVVKILSSSRRTRSAVTIVAMLAVLLVGQFLLLGLRGSRSAVIWVVFLTAALCHYRLRRIPVTWVLIGFLALGVGGYYYMFFKRFGATGFEAIRNPQFRETLSARSGITPVGVLLGDLSRAEIQTFLLYRLVEGHDFYRLRLGKTYVFSLLTVVPRAVWPDKPSGLYGKVGAGTALQHGEGSYQPERFESSRVYGLAGEAMLNFGPAGAVGAYLLYGIMLGWYRKKMLTLHPEDARIYLVPLLTLVAITAMFGDSDNTMFLFLKDGALLTVVVWLSSTRLASRLVTR